MANEFDSFDKAADAAREIAKTASKAIDAADAVGTFFNRVMGDFVVDGFGLLADRLKFYRTERWFQLAHQTQERLTKMGITTFRSVPPKIAIPLIEHATIENEPALQVMWANLLAAAMDPASVEVTRKYVSVLADLTAREAKLFQYLLSYSEIVDAENDLPSPPGNEIDFPFKLAGLLNMESDFDGAIRHLGQLGLMAPGEELALDSFQLFPELDGRALAKKLREDSHEGVYDVRVVSATQDITNKARITAFGLDFATAIGIERIMRSAFSSILD